MRRSADVIVIGCNGAHGSAALAQTAKRWATVIGIDQFQPLHSHGSSHGESRITRLAIGENPLLSTFAIRSHAIWKGLEGLLGRQGKLYRQTGGIMIGEKGGGRTFHGRKDFVGTTIGAAKKYSVDHEIMTAEDIRKRWMFNITDDEYGYYEPEAGVLFPEACIHANLDAAKYYGATSYSGVKVYGVAQKSGSVIVSTSAGEFFAKQCIIAAGAWAPEFLPETCRKHFKITRQVLFWYQPKGLAENYRAGRFPVYIWERHGMYGFPDLGDGLVKVALGDDGIETDPLRIDRRVRENEYEKIESTLKQAIPSLPGRRAHALTCLYTRTPDNDFVIDWHPEMDQVLFLSPCSGHGFKHSAAIGELAAQLVLKQPHDYDLSHFSLSRFK